MEPFLAAHGYPALFALSFLAATLLPLGSEWLLVALLLNRHDPVAAVTVATAGNYLGACTTWLIGMYGGSWLVRTVLRIDEAAENRARQLYARYGAWSLLFSWLPIVGDPLCLVGGVLRVGFGRFSLLVAAGKFSRYAAIAWLTLAGAPLTQ
jgi:membrane protein YqaA with SNARE-associated domain